MASIKKFLKQKVKAPLLCKHFLFGQIKSSGQSIFSKWERDDARSTNSLRYADDTTLMAERKEELRRLLMKVKEESENAGLNSVFKNEDHGIWSPHFMADSSSSLSAVRAGSSAYLRLLILIQAIFISACDSSNPVFHIIYSACLLL